MSFLELFDGYLRIDRSRLQFFVAKELLDEADVRTAFEHVGGATLTEDVAASGLSDFGLLDELADHAADDVGVEGFTVTGEEKGALIGIKEELEAGFFEVAVTRPSISMPRVERCLTAPADARGLLTHLPRTRLGSEGEVLIS